MSFPCDGCGLCCRHVDRSDITQGMNRGDGVCKYLGDDLSTCTIYAARPAFCRIDDSYTFWAKEMSLFDYHEANAAVCNDLRVEHGFTHLLRIAIQN